MLRVTTPGVEDMGKFISAVAIAASLAGIGSASAQPYPLRPITLGMPFAAGGSGDTLARILAERMKDSVGQTVVVENVTGAAGSIGTGRVAHAAPDGRTTHVVNGVVYALPYDVVNDFEPVSLVATQPLLIVAKKAMPADDLKGLVTWLKAHPGQASAGNAGIGSSTYVASIFFQMQTGTRFQLVPYRGGAPAVRSRARRPGPRVFPARSADAGGARHLSGCRDQEVVADYQGGQHQGRIIAVVHMLALIS
jgi:tripartite-type tricarboxylate transporter receptor subunit TctC